MNTHLPMPERTLPPQSADRIRAALMADKPGTRLRLSRTWLLPLAAALVVIALFATAVVLWPRTSRTQIVARPTASPMSASVEPTPMSTELPSPTPRPSSSGTLEPGPQQKPFQTDRGALTTTKAQALINECNAPSEGEEPRKVEVQKVLYARRGTAGQEVVDVTIFRRTDGQEWLCAPASMQVPLDEFNPDNGPNSSFPVVSESGQSQKRDENGITVEWVYRALPAVERIQVRAIVDDKPTRWFEAKVDGGFAYLPIFTPGKFRSSAPFKQILEYQHRAFDKDGREVPVRIMELPR
jgi:hypothetical protein